MPTKRRYAIENFISITGLFFALIFLLFTMFLAIYLGYSQRNIFKEVAQEKKSMIQVKDTSHLKKHENLILTFIGIKRDEYTSEEYEKIIVFYYHESILLTSIYTSILAFFAYRRFRVQLKKDQAIQTRKINNTKHEDLRYMLDYYKAADYVTVYSGDFSWILDNLQLQEVVLKLVESHKIKLHSSQSRDVVLKHVGKNILDKIEANNLITFQEKNRSNIRCSLIEHGGELTFIYKINSGNPPSEDLTYHICWLNEKKDSKYLLKTIQGLMGRNFVP